MTKPANRTVVLMAVQLRMLLAERRIEVSEKLAQYLAGNLHSLTLTLLEAAEEEREEHYDDLREGCNHYGPLDYKFDGGRRPVYCGLCRAVAFYAR